MDSTGQAALAAVGAVVFDFDGTLVLSNAIKHESFYDAAAGLPGGAAAFDAVFAGPHGDRYDICARVAARLGGGDALARQLVDRYTQLCDDRIAAAPEVPGTTATLAAMEARGLSAWIASATPVVPLRAAVRRRGLHTRFAGVFGLPTTKAEALAAVMARTGLPAARVLMVGDAEADRAAAEAAGTPFVAVAAALGGVGGFRSPPAHAFDDLRDLARLLAAG